MVNKITSPITPLEEVDKINEIIDNIPTVNNATLTLTQGGTTKGTFTANASSNVTIDLDAGGFVDVDNKSITTNASDQIQTVGVINSRDSSTAVKTWTGTKAQYDAISTKDVNTLYNITDDVSGGTSVYTKSEVDNLLSVKANSADVYTKTETDTVISTMLAGLYPVGSIYIGTTSTCPIASLISGSTWTLVSSDRVLQGSSSSHSAGSTIAAGLPNISGTLYFQIDSGQSLGVIPPSQSGLFNAAGEYNTRFALPAGGGGKYSAANFNASRSNSIYGKSSTVQPPAYVVNIWQRTA